MGGMELACTGRARIMAGLRAGRRLAILPPRHDAAAQELARFLQLPSRAPIAAGVGGRGLELEQGPVMRAMGKPGAGGRGTVGPVFWLFSQLRDAGSGQLEKRWSPLASGGAAVVRGSGASPDSAVLGSNRRAQAIHGLLAPYPRTTTSFANFGSEASFPLPFIVCACECICRSRACPRPGGWRVASKLGSYKSRGAEKRESRCSRRTSMQGVRVRGVQGCTTPACWSRTRNHAANANPLQRRPPAEARLSPDTRPLPATHSTGSRSETTAPPGGGAVVDAMTAEISAWAPRPARAWPAAARSSDRRR